MVAIAELSGAPSGGAPCPRRTDLFGGRETFRVITLWQPWASLVIAGVKRFETRPQPFPGKVVGTRVAIHAAQRQTSDGEISETLHAICLAAFGRDYRHDLPLGAILGTVEVVDTVSTDRRASHVSVEEIACGDWRPGRWSIGLADPVALRGPMRAAGQQGWWSVRIDPALMARGANA